MTSMPACLSAICHSAKVAMVRLFWFPGQPAVRNVTGHVDAAHRLPGVKYYLMPL